MTTPKILITRPDVPSVAVNMLKAKFDVEIWNGNLPLPYDTLLKKIKGFNGLYFFGQNKIDKQMLDAAGPDLKVLGTMSVGHDHIDLEECKKRGVIVGYTPDVLTAAVAELTVGLVLATARRFFESSQEITNGNWIKLGGWSPMYMCGMQIQGSVVGVVGLGRIGLAIAKLLKAFDVSKILYSGRNPHPKEAAQVDAEYVSFDNLVENSDIIIISCALTPETKEIFNKPIFDKMKPTSILINSSRGGVIKQDDLYDALTTGKIGAAGLDVMTPEPLPTDHPLTMLKNCVLLPHIGSATDRTRIDMATLTSQNIISAFEGLELPARLC